MPQKTADLVIRNRLAADSSFTLRSPNQDGSPYYRRLTHVAHHARVTTVRGAYTHGLIGKLSVSVVMHRLTRSPTPAPAAQAVRVVCELGILLPPWPTVSKKNKGEPPWKWHLCNCMRARAYRLSWGQRLQKLSLVDELFRVSPGHGAGYRVGAKLLLMRGVFLLSPRPSGRQYRDLGWLGPAGASPKMSQVCRC